MQATEQQTEKVWPVGVDADTGARIKAILSHYRLSTNEANERLGYKGRNSKLYKLLANEVRPSYETLVDLLAAFPDVSPGWLLLGSGPMLLGGVVQAAPRVLPVGPRTESAVGGASRVLTVTVGLDGEENTEFVPIVAQAGYTRQHNEPVFHGQLRHYRVPGFESGTFRAFEVAGDSMEPTLNHRDIVVASFVDNWRLLEPGEVYVVVTTESVMLKRLRARITDENQEVLLYSDNYHRKPYALEASEISQLWRVRGYISSYVPSAPDVTIERLWEVIDIAGLDRGEVRRHLEENAPNHASNK